MISKSKVSVWTLGTCLLLAYGAIKEFRPQVPYLNVYLLEASYANLTDDQLASRVYPVWTYSFLIMLLPIMLLTDWLLYKPIIISEAVALVAVHVLLLWGNSLFQMQMMQACFGWATSAEVAYFSYIYATVTSDMFQELTSWVRMATLIGRCCGYALGQLIMLSKFKSTLRFVTYVSFGSVLSASAIACFLPSVSTKMMEKRLKDSSPDQILNTGLGITESRLYFRNVCQNLKHAYGNKVVLKWSIWWAMATCLWTQTINFVQVLWSEIDMDASSFAQTINSTVVLSQDYNGLTEAVNQLLGAAAAYSVQFLVVDWLRYGELCIGILSCLQCICLAASAYLSNLALVYVLYVSYCILYQFGITVATFSVARYVKSASHGLIFGTNTFLALVLQSLLTFVVADYYGLFLPVRTQFLVYAGLQGFLLLLFTTTGLWTLYTTRDSGNGSKLQFSEEESSD